MNELATNVSAVVQVSTDLQTWQIVTPNFTRNLGNDATTGDPILEVEVATGSPKEFIRLNITSQ